MKQTWPTDLFAILTLFSSRAYCTIITVWVSAGDVLGPLNCWWRNDNRYSEISRAKAAVQFQLTVCSNEGRQRIFVYNQNNPPTATVKWTLKPPVGKPLLNLIIGLFQSFNPGSLWILLCTTHRKCSGILAPNENKVSYWVSLKHNLSADSGILTVTTESIQEAASRSGTYFNCSLVYQLSCAP